MLSLSVLILRCILLVLKATNKMKTKIFALMTVASMPFSSVSVDATPLPVSLQVTAVDPTTNQGEPHRGPVLVPEVIIDGHALSFDTSCYGCTLTLLDEDGEVAYTTVVTSGTLVLPSTLSGEYEILLLPDTGSIYFFGTITL